jgi:hypothetical protein
LSKRSPSTSPLGLAQELGSMRSCKAMRGRGTCKRVTALLRQPRIQRRQEGWRAVVLGVLHETVNQRVLATPVRGEAATLRSGTKP